MTERAQHELVEEIKESANSAKTSLVKLMASEGRSSLPLNLDVALASITAFANSMTGLSVLLSRKIAERKARFDNTPILEAVITCGENTRKIVVAKPNDRVDEPFITESFYTAIRAKWNSAEPITTTEDYDIVVINRKGKRICTIAHK